MWWVLRKLVRKNASYRRVKRIGRDRVQVEIGERTLSLQGELCKDQTGYYIAVSTPDHMFWNYPRDRPVTEKERVEVKQMLNNSQYWDHGERFEVA
jgi:hypothetical protein